MTVKTNITKNMNWYYEQQLSCDKNHTVMTRMRASHQGYRPVPTSKCRYHNDSIECCLYNQHKKIQRKRVAQEFVFYPGVTTIRHWTLRDDCDTTRIASTSKRK